MPLGKLIYMPEESTPTIATDGNREAVAYLEPGDHTDHYGQLFARAPQTADFVSTIAAMKKDGEDGWFMEGDDAIDVVNRLIDEARSLRGKANEGGITGESEDEELVQFTEAQTLVAFDQAIAAGVLSADPDEEQFVGNYMFMGALEEGDAFKNIWTRQYVYHKVGDAS